MAQNGGLTVTATEYDQELAAAKDFVEIKGDKAFWKNKWDAAGKEVVWDMVHYDTQFIGGVALHSGRIAEMATGEGKTLVGTLPIYLNALPGRGVHVVTVNDYLAKRDSAWMGPIYQFHGLSIDCIDLHQPNTDARRKAYQADITYGTNNEFGFDYLRDNMVSSPEELVQGELNFAIVDEVDSVLIDDARTPLIISGPIPQGDRQEFDVLKPSVDRIVAVQKQIVSNLLTEAKKLIAAGNKTDGGFKLLQAYRGLPKNKHLIKFLSEEGIRVLLQKTEGEYMQDNSKRMRIVDKDLYFVIDEKNNQIDLTDKGVEYMSQGNQDANFFVLEDIGTLIAELEAKNLTKEEEFAQKEELFRNYAVKSERIHTLNQLLKAYTLFEKDDEYVVIDGEVKIVDEQTGRIMEGRRYSDGLHQAIEAKENVKIEAATQTFATITLQNYFRMYNKLAGMTGTAETEAGEFWQIYKLDVVVIPTNRPIIRDDRQDLVYKTNREKFNAVIDEIERLTAAGRPVLVGTTSVEISQFLSKALQLRKIPHNVLNAKLHKKEADIVAEAGRAGVVTIATNMAGRGTDILLGGNAEYLAKEKLAKEFKDEELHSDPEKMAEYEARLKELTKEMKVITDKEHEEVTSIGGLHIIGTERHEARRIDNQLRGRAGRQGDPGTTRFFLSLEDQLMRIFGGQHISRLMDIIKADEDMPIESGMVTNSIEGAQKKVEAHHFDMRKHVLQYDDVLSTQREVIYRERRRILEKANLRDGMLDMMKEHLDLILEAHLDPDAPPDLFEESGLPEVLQALSMDIPMMHDVKVAELKGLSYDDMREKLWDAMETAYKVREEHVGLEEMREFERQVLLHNIDTKWVDYLHNIDLLREGIQLRAYAQKDPLQEYKREAFNMFNQLLRSIQAESIQQIFRAQPQPEPMEIFDISQITADMIDPSQLPDGVTPEEFLSIIQMEVLRQQGLTPEMLQEMIESGNIEVVAEGEEGLERAIEEASEVALSGEGPSNGSGDHEEAVENVSPKSESVGENTENPVVPPETRLDSSSKGESSGSRD